VKRLLFVTGRPGVGKTTVVLNAVDGLKAEGRVVGGMISREVRREGSRIGFEIVDVKTNEKGWLAHVDQPIGPQVGKYTVNLTDLDAIGVKAIQTTLKEADLVVVDEIGPMELSSQAFKQIIKEAIDSQKLILGVIHHNARDPIIESVKGRDDTEIFEVTFENRSRAHNILIQNALQYLQREKQAGKKAMLVAGVDDAGRGPIIGPLVIAGVLIAEENLNRLQPLGVKDSKLLSALRREQLAVAIKNLAVRYHIESLSPAEIDRVVETGRKLHRLNRLEANTMAKVIEVLKPDIAYVDASDVLADRYKAHIIEKLTFPVRIISEHKADAKYPVVSAASIIAKVERDRAVQELKEKYGDLGSGYVTDPKTVEFLEKWFVKHSSYPEFVRKSWKPAKEMRSNARAKQMKLE